MSDLTADDLRDLRDVITSHVDKRCDALENHLKELNGRTRTAESKIAVLEDRESRAGLWSGGIGAAVVGLFEGFKLLWK